jgi:hypothetical protein
MKKQLIISLLIFLLVLSFGCYEMTRAQKNACYSLTSRSYDYIPSCETEESCFSKVDSMFKTNLGYEQESNLYELKNHFARSWFFYNKAIKELKATSRLCQQGNAGALPGAINQTRHYLDSSFTELDLGIKKSFDIISAEEQYLSKEKIDLLKEEKLFDSLTELRQVLTELENGATNSDTYVSFYLNKVNAFNNSNATKVIPNLIEKESFWIKSFDVVEGTILEKLGLGKESDFPFIAKGLDKTINYFEAKLYSDESLSALGLLPASEFMKLYSDIGGADNSALKRFADLVNNTSTTFEALLKKQAVFWEEVEEKYSSCKVLFEQVKDNETIDFIESKLSTGTISSNENLLDVFNRKTSIFLDLKQRKGQSALTLGEEISRIKLLRNTFIEIEGRLLFQQQERSGKLAELCKKKAIDLKERKIELEKEPLTNIHAEMLFFATKTIQIPGEFNYCRTMIEKAEDLEQGINNFEELKAKQVDLTKSCFDSLDKIFDNYSLQELENLFEQLKQEKVTQENLFYFSDACEKIKQQAITEINEDNTINKLEEQINELFVLKAGLEELLMYAGNPVIEDELEKINEKLVSWKSYFDRRKLIIENVLPVKEELLLMLQTQNEKMNILLTASQIEYIKSTITINILNNSIIKTNEDFNSVAQVIITNPFGPINKRVRIVLKFDGELIRKDPVIESVFHEDGAVLVLSVIPTGKTIAEFVLVDKIESVEIEKIIFATNKESLVQRNISLTNNPTLTKVLVETLRPNNCAEIVVMVNGDEINYYLENKKIYFVVENANATTKISVFLYLTNLITTSLHEISRSQTSEYTTIIHYEFVAKNNSDEALIGSLFLPFVYDAEQTNIEISDSLGTKKQKSIVENKVVLKNQAFLEKEERKYFIQLKIDDVLEYYYNQLNVVLNELNKYNETTVSKQIEMFLEYDFDSSKTPEAEKLLQTGLQKLEQLEYDKDNETMLALLKEEIEQKIAELEAQQQELTKLGLDNEKKKLDELLHTLRDLLKKSDEKSYSKALALIEELTFDADQTILEEIKTIWNKLQLSTPIEDSHEFDAIKERIFLLKNEIEKEIAFEPEKARANFVELQKQYTLFETRARELEDEASNRSSEIVLEIEELTKQCFAFIGKLETELVFDEKDFIKIRFIPPITKSRLAKIKLILNSEEFKNKEEQLLKVKELFGELKAALDSIKLQTAKKYNNGIDSGLSGGVLSRAKQFIDSNQFVNAMFALEGREEVQNNLLIGIIPILAIVVVGLVLRQKFAKTEKKEDKIKKQILEEWE